jgi:hypothetical protein
LVSFLSKETKKENEPLRSLRLCGELKYLEEDHDPKRRRRQTMARR